MTEPQLKLVSHWRIAAPLDRVWRAIGDVDAWPSWWRAVRQVERLRDGDSSGVGALRRMTWKTALPYTLSFELEATRVEPQRQLEGRARGELDGIGLWTFEPAGDETRIRYDWHVSLGKAWMRALLPILRPAFIWNHNVIMGWGEADLKKHLGV